MPLKDHYRTLGVPAHAAGDAIKKAYRTLAHKYHPDKNPDNPYGAAHFIEIKEAYYVLSDAKRREAYDEERYFAGLTAQKQPTVITPDWILRKSKELAQHMALVDSYRMNHRALHDHIMLLLSDSHMAVLKDEGDTGLNNQLIKQLLSSVKKINYTYFQEIARRLTALAGTDGAMLALIFEADRERRRHSSAERKLPLIVLLVTLLICLLMYLYSRQ